MYSSFCKTIFMVGLSVFSLQLRAEETSIVKSKNILQHLSTEQKIGQLFMVAAVADEQKSKLIMHRKSYRMDQEYIEKLIQEHHIGGLIFFGTSTPAKQKQMIEHYQQLSKIPLLIGQDLEWGLAMHLQQVTKLPYAMTLGAIEDNNLIYELGKEIGNQCKAIGVHINFAPVADVSNNPLNPVINYRSFGQDEKKIAQKAIAFMKGLQDAGIIACAKHFPGHGDTNIDSHVGLPCILHNKDHFNAIELYPFKELIQKGVNSIMIAHLLVPAFDTTNLTSLSSIVITNLLKDNLGFSGLIITDALDMNGVTKSHEDGEIALQALRAGNDILLCPRNVPKAINKIKEALTNGTLTMQELDDHVQKILQVKQKIRNQASSQRDPDQLDTTYTYTLKKKLYRAAITLAKNSNQVIPLTINNLHPIPLIQIGSKQQEQFATKLMQQQQIKLHIIRHDESEKNIMQLRQGFNDEETIIVSIHEMTQSVQNDYGITNTTKQLLNNLNKENKQIIVVIFGNPYSMQFFKDIPAIIIAYEDEAEAQIAAADVIFGNLKPRGTLPVTIPL